MRTLPAALTVGVLLLGTACSGIDNAGSPPAQTVTVTAHAPTESRSARSSKPGQTEPSHSSLAGTTPAESNSNETTSSETAPPELWPGATFSTEGYGPLRLGMSARELEEAGLAVLFEPCTSWRPTKSLKRRGLYFSVRPDERLAYIDTEDPYTKTPSGAHPGMPLTTLKRILPQLKRFPDSVMTFGAEGYYVTAGGRTMAFLLDENQNVALMQAIDGPITKFVPRDGC